MNYQREVENLINDHKHFKEMVDRLSKMQGVITQKGVEDEGLPKLSCIKFESGYTASAHTFRRTDAELHVRLAAEALKYYQDRLRITEFLMKLMHEAVMRNAPLPNSASGQGTEEDEG